MKRHWIKPDHPKWWGKWDQPPRALCNRIVSKRSIVGDAREVTCTTCLKRLREAGIDEQFEAPGEAQGEGKEQDERTTDNPER